MLAKAIARRLDSGVDSRLYANCEADMLIGEVAQNTGLSIDTIRFYEKESLIGPPQRSAGGYRLYDEHAVDRLQLIGRAQQLGFSLQEIRELLVIEDGESGECSHVRDLIASKIEQVKAKIAGLKSIEKRLAKAQQQCNAALTNSCDVKCPVLQELESGKEKVSR
ncbi:Zn(2+)-responsive transcriptional regulator [Terriglobus aquaticus]